MVRCSFANEKPPSSRVAPASRLLLCCARHSNRVGSNEYSEHAGCRRLAHRRRALDIRRARAATRAVQQRHSCRAGASGAAAPRSSGAVPHGRRIRHPRRRRGARHRASVEHRVPSGQRDARDRDAWPPARDSRRRSRPGAGCGSSRGQAARRSGLLDIALHPKFAENRLVYFTYHKPLPNDQSRWSLHARAGTARRSSAPQTCS